MKVSANPSFLLTRALIGLLLAAIPFVLYQNALSRINALRNDERLAQVFSAERATLVQQIFRKRAQTSDWLDYSLYSRTLPNGVINGLEPIVDRDTFRGWLNWHPEGAADPGLTALLFDDGVFASGMPKRYAALIELWHQAKLGGDERLFERLYQVAGAFWRGEQLEQGDYAFLLSKLPERLTEIFCNQLAFVGLYPPLDGERLWVFLQADQKAHLIALPAARLERLNSDLDALNLGARFELDERWNPWAGMRAGLAAVKVPFNVRTWRVWRQHIAVGVILYLVLLLIDLVLNRYQKVNRMQKQLLAATSHELRTPLAVIRQFAEMLLDRRGQFGERVQLYHRYVFRECVRMQFLVENLLSVARFEQLQPKPHPEAFLLDEWLRELVDTTSGLEGGFEVTLTCPAVEVYWDRGWMGQVFRNLLENARVHAGTKVEMECEQNTGRLSVSVRDFGEHVDLTKIRGIRAFKRGMSPNTGLGLGLYLVDKMVSYHRGRLSFEDAKPGLRVKLDLPLRLEERG